MSEPVPMRSPMEHTRVRRTAGVLLLTAGLLLGGGAGAAVGRDGLPGDPPIVGAAGVLEGASAATAAAVASYEQAVAQEPAAQKALAVARASLAASATRYDSAAARARQSDDDLLSGRERVLTTADAVSTAEQGYAAVARALYESGPTPAIGAVVAAQDPQDLAVRLQIVHRVGEQAGIRLAELRSAQGERDAGQRALDVAQRGARQAEVALRELLLARQVAAQQAAAALQQVRQLSEQRAAAVTAARAEQAGDEQRYAQLSNASSQVGALLGSSPTGSAVSPGSLAWPTSGTWTGGYGPRRDPFTGAAGFHPGDDIAAPTGTPIVAAADGTVALVQDPGRSGGYGNYTCLDHGGGLATCYAHQSQVLVAVGQTVRRGQVIGAVGTTGYSTGPHLHFEVRIGGRPVDPLPYLPAR